MSTDVSPKFQSLAASLVTAIEAAGDVGSLADPTARNTLRRHKILKTFSQRASTRTVNASTIGRPAKIRAMYDMLVSKVDALIANGIYRQAQVSPTVLMLQVAADIFHVILYVEEPSGSEIVTSKVHRTGTFIPRRHTKKSTESYAPHIHIAFDGSVFRADFEKQKKSARGSKTMWAQRIKVPRGPVSPQIPDLLTPEEEAVEEESARPSPSRPPPQRPPSSPPSSPSPSSSLSSLDALPIALGIGGVISSILAGVRMSSG